VDCGLDYFHSHPGFQQPAQSDRMLPIVLNYLVIQIPNLLLQTALFASWFTYGLSGIFWLFMNKGFWFSSPRKIALTALNFFVIAIGTAIVRLVYLLFCHGSNC
jgi:hypothetical protein